MPIIFRNLTLSLLVLGLAVFSSVGCKKQVKRMSVEEVKDLSGYWNDTDSRLVSEEMIQDATSRPWVDTFSQKKNRKPIVIVGLVVNKTHEHINTETFVKDLERALLNTGKVTFVANRNERGGIREEREDMDNNAEPVTRKGPGHETGADYMIIGAVNSIIDQEKKKVVAYYQVELEAVDMLNNEKVWIGQKKLKKYIKRQKGKF